MANKWPDQVLDPCPHHFKDCAFFHSSSCFHCCLFPRKERVWDGILIALASCSQPQEKTDISFWLLEPKGEATLSAAVVFSWEHPAGPREPVLSSEARKPAALTPCPFMGFLLPVLWPQGRAEKPYNCLYLFEHRFDHICLPC